MGVDDQGMHAIDRPVIEIEESRRLVVAGHEAGLRIDRADLDLLAGGWRVVIVFLERLLASRRPIRFDCCIQFG